MVSISDGHRQSPRHRHGFLQHRQARGGRRGDSRGQTGATARSAPAGRATSARGAGRGKGRVALGGSGSSPPRLSPGPAAHRVTDRKPHLRMGPGPRGVVKISHKTDTAQGEGLGEEAHYLHLKYNQNIVCEKAEPARIARVKQKCPALLVAVASARDTARPPAPPVFCGGCFRERSRGAPRTADPQERLLSGAGEP